MRDPDAAQRLAEQVRDGMFARDAALRFLGVTVTQVAPGAATVAMRVRDEMLNGHGTCHGGFIAALADSAFAYACNSYNELTVASGFSVDFLAPARAGDLLEARCNEISRAGRTGVYDAIVTNARGDRLAVFRGRSYTARGTPAVAAAGR